jgi:hypothetical protein
MRSKTPQSKKTSNSTIQKRRPCVTTSAHVRASAPKKLSTERRESVQRNEIKGILRKGSNRIPTVAFGGSSMSCSTLSIGSGSGSGSSMSSCSQDYEEGLTCIVESTDEVSQYSVDSSGGSSRYSDDSSSGSSSDDSSSDTFPLSFSACSRSREGSDFNKSRSHYLRTADLGMIEDTIHNHTSASGVCQPSDGEGVWTQHEWIVTTLVHARVH